MKRYDNLDGLRTFSAIGIILMHVLENGNFEVTNENLGYVGLLIFSLIGRMGVFVQLFFMISAFGMCCGYYEKIKNNNISLGDFYEKRYNKILPFFAMLVLIDIVISGFNLTSLIEGFADVTLLYGFLPDSSITVIGVGWTLGVIFAFYIIFPFFVFMLWNKRRAWISLFVSLVMYYLCTYYFVTDREPTICNLLAWLYYFVVGGIIFLYRDSIEKIVSKNRWLMGIIVILLTYVWYTNKIGVLSVILISLLFTSLLCYAISVKSQILSNKVTRFISGISLEIYLAHMLIYRVVEKMNLLYVFTNNILNYIFTVVLVMMGAIMFAYIAQKCISKIMLIIHEKKRA